MLHEQFEHQNVANSIENETFELKNAANTIEIAVSSSKMLQMQDISLIIPLQDTLNIQEDIWRIKSQEDRRVRWS